MGQKPPLKAQQIWAISIRLQIDDILRDLALFNLATDSKLRGCDLVKLKVSDISHGWPCAIARPGDSAENREAGSICDHGAGSTGCEALDRKSLIATAGLFIPKQNREVAAYFDTTLRPNPGRMGFSHRPRPRRLRHPFVTKNQGCADL